MSDSVESSASAPSDRARVRRVPKRAVYERETVAAILDAARVSHLGTVRDGAPVVVPMLHARVGDLVYLHGSSASVSVRGLRDGLPACLTATLIDGLVLARSAFHHSANYRSVVVHGSAVLVEDPDEKLAALEAFTEKVLPGRWREVRPPNPLELKATAVLALPLEESSAKVRDGDPVDDEEDYELDCWAGVVPLETIVGTPVPDARLRPGTPLSQAVSRLAG
ncbi:MAG TPA: pyridoxamine 5'-phosphate oxidase family protein [Thermoleophilaceae bacterium]|nr:pyridoxamine 5'-phosphate oxidase family protein [Thermoleophilaceae bacterium]